MPGLLYGTAWKKEDTERLVGLAIRAGFRGFDTACQPKHYNEPAVGAAVTAAIATGIPRADLYLQTKYTPVSGQDPARLPYDPSAPPALQVRQSLEASLRNLATPYVDCLILHSPLSSAAATLEVWRAMESVVSEAGALTLGISNCYEPASLHLLWEAARIKPVALQNRFYAATGYDRELRAYCRTHAVVYQSFWTLTANPHLLAHPLIEQLAAAQGRTPAQILFRYLSQLGIVPLTGTTSAAHMREDLDIFTFELTAAQCAHLESLFPA